MQVWCPSDHVYCQKVGLPRRHFRHGENGSRLRFLEISRKIPRYRAKNTVLGTYRRKPVDFRARRHPNLRPRLEPFLQGKSATLQKYQKGVFMVQSLKNLQNKQPRTGAFFCKPFRNLQGKFESFLLLTAEKKGSVRTRSGMTACEQGGKGLVDHSEACQ